MDEDTWYEVEIHSEYYARQPGIWKWWPSQRGGYFPGFRHYMDDAIEDAKSRARVGDS